jgi:metallo-beta-lactamase class B
MTVNKIGYLLMFLLLLGQQAHAQPAESRQIRSGVALLPLTAEVAIHTSFKNFQNAAIPANGLVINTQDGLVLVDATWDNYLAKNLLKETDQAFGGKVRYVLVTSAHEDRIGGLAFWQRQGAKVICHRITALELVARGFAAPEIVLAGDSVLTLGQVRLEVCFPGAGHTPDNLAVWLPEAQILFGGGLVRSATTRGPGDTADADLIGWKAALEILHQRYLQARIVVPGIGPFGGADLLKHSHNIVVRAINK